MSRKAARNETAPGMAGPFSRPLDVHAVPDGGLETAIEANDGERAEIAAELGLVAVGALSAHFRVERRAGGRLAVDGQVEAAITQTCVVSLEPFDSRITRDLALTFAPQSSPVTEPAPRSRRREPAAREAPPRPVTVPGSDEQEDPPDPIVDGRIDLGAVALEFLTLSLELYPRKPGVHFADVSTGDTDAADSPFATLQRLKDRP